MKNELIVHRDPKSPISEVFRTLRTNIQFMSSKRGLKSILVTSTLPGEGKSFVSANLAITFAQANKRVILIDADMRKGRLYSMFGISPTPGLSNYLSGVDWNYGGVASDDLGDYIQETNVDNLFVLTAGNVPPNPSELLISDQMKNLMKQLNSTFDIIIFDGTPSQLVTDSLILARMVDTAVIVTACKETKKEDLKRVIKNIKHVGGRIAGVVINKMILDAKRYEQSYYYGSSSKRNPRPANVRNNPKPGPRPRPTNSRPISPRPNPNNINRENHELNNMNEQKKSPDVPSAKTAEILNQINQYLEEEKRNMQ